jgi:cold shock CspA family protein
VTEHRDGARGRHAGIVASFDAEVGLGDVTGEDGTTYPFHCIEIADGSRDIAVGTAVDFTTLAKLGRYEAADIRSR